MTGNVVAIGRLAQQMHGKTHKNIETIRPLKDGVIADFESAEQMIKGMIKLISGRKSWFNPSLRMVICIPSGITDVEKRAVKDSAEHAGGKEVYLIHEPMAAAIGIGIDVEEPMGNMIVDIGGGTSEIAVIALGGIVTDTNIRVAGDEFTHDIEEYMRRQHNILIGERTAEQIKIAVGSALTELDNPPEDYAVHGRHLLRNCWGLGQKHQQNRRKHPHCVGAYAPRIVGGHLQNGHLPCRGRGVAEGPRQAHFTAYQAPRARGRRPAARGREGHGHRTEKHRPLPVLDAELIAELCATSLSFSHASIGGCSLWQFGRARWLG
jgi:hypothetical protein